MHFLQRVIPRNNLLKHLCVQNVNEVSRRSISVALPPKKKLKVSELAACFLGVHLTCWAYPFWVIFHIKEYQKPKKKGDDYDEK